LGFRTLSICNRLWAAVGDGSDLAYWIILFGLVALLTWVLYRGWRSAGRDSELWRGWVRRHRKGQPPDRPSLPPTTGQMGD